MTGLRRIEARGNQEILQGLLDVQEEIDGINLELYGFLMNSTEASQHSRNTHVVAKLREFKKLLAALEARRQRLFAKILE